MDSSAFSNAVRTGDKAEAARLARELAKSRPNDPAALNFAAYHSIQNDDLEGAFELLVQALKAAPENIDVLLTLANLQRRRGQTPEARRILVELCARDPANAPARFNLARLLEDLGEFEAAKSHYQALLRFAPNDQEAMSRLFYLTAIAGQYEEALRYHPSTAEHQAPALAYGKLATIALRRADYSGARELSMRALAFGPDARAEVVLAEAEFRCGEPEHARRRLEILLGTALSAEARAFAHSLLGDIADLEQREDDAFTNYQKSKSILAQHYAPQFGQPHQRTALMLIESLLTFFKDRDLSGGATDLPSEPAPREHVFLVGFPRSGTTLLEQSLALHPDIRTLDESGRLMELTQPLWISQDGLGDFVRASDAMLEKYRSGYWNQVRGLQPDLHRKIVVDKMPLNSVLMPIASRLFPRAKFLFAIRDPRDVVFSCFRTRFTMTAFMYEFCTPVGAARLYDCVMSLCQVYRRTLRAPLLETRYENFLADYSGNLDAVCEFLGVERVEGMSNPETRVRKQVANTPSSAQVARGLYDGSRHWRRYAAHLSDATALVDPWVRRFGYDTD